MRKDFSKYLDKEGMIELACELIKKRTVNPPGSEYLTKDFSLIPSENIHIRYYH